MSPSPTPVRSKVWHVSKPVRVLAYAFGGLVLGYLVVVAVLSTAWFNRALLERTRASLERVTGARVEIGQMRINPWVLQATFRGLVMRGSEAGKELPLFTARELVVRASVKTLIHRRTLRLARVDLEGAAIHLYTRLDGSTNLPGPAAQAEGLRALDDLVDLGVWHLLIAQSNLYWDDREWPLDLSAHNISLLMGLHQSSYTGSLSASAVDVSCPGIRLPEITVSTRVAISKNSLSLSSLTWRSSGLRGDGAVALHWLPAIESQFSFRFEGEASSLARILRQDEFRQGELNVDGQGRYRQGAIDARGHLDGHRLVLRAPQFASNPLELSADYVLQGQRLLLPRLTASILGGTASGSAELSLASIPAIRADLDLRDLDVTRAVNVLEAGPALMADFPVASRASGKVRLFSQGPKADSQFDLQFSPPDVVTAGREPLNGSARGSASLSPRPSVELESADLHTLGSTLKLRGAAAESSLNLAFQLNTTDFGEWKRGAEFFAERPLPAKLDSTAIFSGTVTGSLRDPLVGGQLQVGSFEYENWKWSSLQANLVVGPEALRVTSGRLVGGPNSALTLEATAALNDWLYLPGAPFRLSARADRTSIVGLREVLGIQVPLSGDLTGEFHVNESRNQLAGGGSVVITAGSYAGERFDSIDAEASADREVWKLTRFSLKKSGGEMTADGSFDPSSQSVSAHAQGRGLALASFARLQALAPAGASNKVQGTLNFDLSVQGSLDRPSADGQVAVEGLTAGEVALGNLSGRLRADGRHATLQGQVQGPAGRLDFQASSPVENLPNSEIPLTLSAQYSGLRLDPWMRALGAGVTGTVEATGNLEYSGTLRGSETSRVKSAIQSLEVSFAGMHWSNVHPFEISLERQHVEITPFDLHGPSTEFRFQGSADLGAISSLNLRADGQIDSQFLHVFDPALLTTGRFDVEAQVQGSLRQPLLYGSLKLDQVSIGYPGLPLRLAGLNGTVDLQGDRLTVRSLRAESGPASVVIAGSATLSDTPRYNLRAEFSHMRVAYPVQFTSVVSGTGRLSGTPGAGVLSGDLTVEQMYVGENFNVLNWASALATQPAATLEGASPLSSGVRMDVHVVSSPTVSVESRDFSAVAAVDLSLRGTLADPVVFGNVHIQSGQAVLRQTSYKLTHGDVILANPLRTEPTLDLEATTRVQRYDLVLRVTGPADRPNISYRSDPPLSTPSILALLAFGYTTQDQLQANTGRSSFSTQGASALLSQALSSQVSSRFTRLFGLSRISIDPNPISTGGTQVTVEERLARDFTITYVTTTGGILERIIQVEWDLSDTMSLLGVRDQNGVYGFELDFRKRFK
jgi:translocation and assembly module TamB